MKKINNITPFSEDISKWYSDIVLKSELIIYGPVKGTMYLRPYGFEIWKNISSLLNKEFAKENIEEVRFPLLFPESFLEKEKNHVEGFSPEVLTVTKIGKKNLKENLCIRPTSETLFGDYFSQVLNSYSQLPMKLNQWVNILRWENNTRPFLRNSEFFWQEGHTVHSTKDEAIDFSIKMHDIYNDFANNFLLLPTIMGEKTVLERFAGAEKTYTIETILKDGQALQSGTSHYLGDSFAKSFNVKIQGKDNKFFYPFQTSWGVSTRLIGAIIMTHSDDKGLILPSKIAPFHIAILTINSNENIIKICENIKNNLTFKVKIDSSDKGIGFKSQKWELKGVPIRIEIGPNEIENDFVFLKIRKNDKKLKFKISEINDELISKLILEYDEELYKEALKNRENKKVKINSTSEIKNVINSGKYAIGYWTENKNLEKKIKEETGATIRCLIKHKNGKCIHSGNEINKLALFARSY